MSQKVFVGMSGGVVSSLTAAPLVDQGWRTRIESKSSSCESLEVITYNDVLNFIYGVLDMFLLIFI